MSKRVLLHVGTPKTGTSHLQDVLFRNREVLVEHGILYPAERFDGQFLAALDLMDLPWGGLEAEAVGAWADLAQQVREFEGTSIVSHEILATATRPQIAQALRDLGLDPVTGEGPEIHLLITTRDLVRQIPAEWQENIKHRATLSYHAFLDVIADPTRPGRIGSWFWSVQEIPDILERWGAALPPEQVHVVTVPPRGADHDELWRRLSAAFGLDGLPLDLSQERANPSLGVPESALLRRINRRVVDEIGPTDYRPLVRELLAHQTLSRRTQSPRLALPAAAHARARELSESWVAQLRERGYQIVGSWEDLLGAEPGDFADPDHPDEAQVAGAAVEAIAALLEESLRLEHIVRVQHADLGTARAEIERLESSLPRRAKRAAYRRLNGSGAGQQLLQVYRRARGRSSREA